MRTIQTSLCKGVYCPFSLYARRLCLDSTLNGLGLVVRVAPQVGSVEVNLLEPEVFDANHARLTLGYWFRLKEKRKKKNNNR